MAGLIDMIINNPAIAKTIAKQVGIDVGDAGSIIGKLAPILMGGAKSNLNSEKDSGGLLKHIEQNNYADIFDKPEAHVNDGNFKNMGNDILAELTGSKENSREVARHVEEETGMSSSIIKSVLPMLAPMIIGALTKKSAPNMGGHSSTQSSSMTDMLSGLIDQDNDGSAIDDIMGMAAKFIFK
ncbi:MAG: Unknown protein [uncultured Sulfurovum sp.]|uniref:DUF937 domain-containing protein n=1 Tax=uncultured Sulfurovum sp. TaxID=269237 RepID=A0A6S6T7M7_9BACT|nr:MAG: Unknown protein [uncultured Sulfurovum sp.]